MRDINAENQIENILVEEEEDNYNLNYENTNNLAMNNHNFEIQSTQPLIATTTSESSSSTSSSCSTNTFSPCRQQQQQALNIEPQTAYLLQTSNGNAILIHTQNQPNFILNSNTLRTLNYGFYQQQQHEQRPDSNVYQTIDPDLNNKTSTFKSTKTNSFSFNNNQKLNNPSYLHPIDTTTTYYHDPSTLSTTYNPLKFNQSNTLKSNSNKTNCNLLQQQQQQSKLATHNRRHDNKFFCNAKEKLNKTFNIYCSWKCIALCFLLIILILFGLSLYLSILRVYNLNWNLKEIDKHSLQALSSNINPILVPIVKHNDRTHVPILFSKIGDTIEDTIQSNEFFKLQFYIDTPNYIQFNVTIAKNLNFGIYANLNQAPSHTKFKFFETINEDFEKMKRQSALTMVNYAFIHYLDEGLWYISLYNDNQENLRFKFITNIYESKCLSNCNNNGECIAGKCVCFNGYKGNDCSLIECSTQFKCSNNGKYESGKCNCDLGWYGNDCSLKYDLNCNCNNNGECVLGKCVCHPGFKGESCDEFECKDSLCSNNGLCRNGTCLCFNGFTGDSCETKLQFNSAFIVCSGSNEKQTIELENDKISVYNNCSIACSSNGNCLNGTCICKEGYFGRNCDKYVCPNNCSDHGNCVEINARFNKYQCLCSTGWTGQSCDIQMELTCNDNIDNDNDGLFDCDDSECCSFEVCRFSPSCATSPEPKDRLLRKQPPSILASFYDKVRFLIEDGSVQVFATSSVFNENRVCVIRGQVLFGKNNQPLIGVKVSVPSNAWYGFTFSRINGIFDLMVNCGGSIQLQFTRNGFKSKLITVNTEWNQFVYVNDVLMYLIDDKEPINSTEKCNIRMLMNKSIVATSWKQIRSINYDTFLPDSGIIRSEVNLIDSSLNLVYMSSQANGYYSSLYILLTQNKIPDDLELIYVEILIEGVLNRQEFIARPNLMYEYSWDRRNAYEQRVYGLTTGKISVGFKHENCSNIYWNYYTIKLAGFDLPISEIGSWSVNIHHRLNPQQGILHKGDGTNIYLREMEKNLQIVAGQYGLKRDLNCKFCKESLRFYSPSSISINKDGKIFIADFDSILAFDNKKILYLENDQQTRIFLGNNPLNGDLYMSHQIKHGLYKVISLDNIIDPKNNTDNKLSNKCKTYYNVEDDKIIDECNKNETLNSPRDLVIDKNGLIYVIDGNLIKIIDHNYNVKVLIGKQDTQYHAPICSTTYDLNEFQLFWPKALSISPLDNSLYMLDKDVVYRLNSNGIIQVVAGIPFDCLGDKSTFSELHNAIDIDFSPNGDLLILENDKESIKRVVKLKSNGQLETYFSGFSDPIALAVHPNSSVYVLDQKDLVLYHIQSMLVKDNNGQFNIISPDTNEAYVFSRFGLHLNTYDLISGNTLYNFSYTGNAAYGKLSSIMYQNNNQLNMKRDFYGRVDSIQTPNGKSLKFKLNNLDLIRTIQSSDGKYYNFTYLANTGLLISQNNFEGVNTKFEYEKNGHAKNILDSNGLVININYSMNASGIISNLKQIDGNEETWISNLTTISIFKNSVLNSIIQKKKFNRQNLNINFDNINLVDFTFQKSKIVKST